MKAQEQKSSMEQKEEKKRQTPKPEFNRSAQKKKNPTHLFGHTDGTQHVDGRDAILTWK